MTELEQYFVVAVIAVIAVTYTLYVQGTFSSK